MKIELHKVHLNKNNQVSFEYKETDKESTAPVAKGPYTAAVHEDLILAMAQLDPHLALMTEQMELSAGMKISKLPAEDYENFHAKSITVTGDKVKGVIISGNRVLETGKVFNFNTPNYLQESGEETGYPWMADVLQIMGRVFKEGLAFLDGTKRGTDPQGKIPFSDEKGSGTKTVVQIAPPADNALQGEWEPGEYPADVKNQTKNISVKSNGGLPKDNKKAEKVVPEGKVIGKGKVEPVKILPGKTKGKARVAQSAAAPSGEIDHPEEN